MGLFSRDSDSGSGGGDADGEETRFWQERGFVASAIVVGAVVVCVLVWVFARGSGTPTSQPTETPSTVVPTEQPTATTTPATPPPLNNSKGGCHNTKPDQRIPRLAPPPAVTWQFEADMLVPLQQDGGPATTDRNGVRSCFAHSPTGAVLASMVLLGQIRNPDMVVEVLEKRVQAGAGRTRALDEALHPTTPRTPVHVQFAGFKVIDYQRNRAIIQVAAEIDNQNVASLPVTMVWSGGDWKAALQADGTFNGEVDPDVLQSMDGYVRFSGSS